MPCLVRPVGAGGVPRLGHGLLDDYLQMVAARARPNTVLAAAFDLKVFFTVVAKWPEEVDRRRRTVFHRRPTPTETWCRGGAD